MNPLTKMLAAVRNYFGGAQQTGLPTERINWLGPRFEPGNISSTAKMQDVNTAIREAENGETTSLFRFYRDSLLNDDLIQGELSKRKLAVIGQPTAVLPADKESVDDVAAAAACLRAICDCENWNAGLGALLNASQWPVAVAENIFRAADPEPVSFTVKTKTDLQKETKETKGSGQRTSLSSLTSVKSLSLQYTLKRIEPVNPMLFCFRHAYLVGGVGYGSSTPVQQIGLNDKSSGLNPDWYSVDLADWEPFLRLWPIDDQGRIIYDASRASKLDPDRHVVHRGHLLTDQRDNWGGPMRAILFWWLLRGLGRDWFGRFMERYGMPFPVGKTNVQDAEAVKLLRDAFGLATKIGGLVIGQEDQVELQQAMVQGGAEGHALWHRTCNDAISRHIVGYGNSDKPSGLNAGESQMQAGVRQDVRIFDQRMLAETLEKQLFARFLRFNGLKGRVRVAWGGLNTDDAKTFADLLKTAKEAGWEPTDGAIPVIEDRFGIEVRRCATPALPDRSGFRQKAGDNEHVNESDGIR